MSKTEDNYKAYLRSEAERATGHLRIIKIFGEGITIDIEVLRLQGVQVKIADPDGSFDYKGPDESIAPYNQSRRKANKILKITGQISLGLGTEMLMRPEPLGLELLPVDIKEEAVKADGGRRS